MQGKREFKLEIANIDNAADFIHELLKKYKCSDHDIVRAQLFAEETILFWLDSSGQGGTFQVDLRKRLKMISLILTCRGMQSNPLAIPGEEDSDSEFQSIGRNILIGLSNVTYSYENGNNLVAYTLKVKSVNPVVYIFTALALAIICGLAVNAFAPALGPVLSTSLLTPLSNSFFGLLNAIVIPFLFVSVIASIFNMENLAQMKSIFRVLFSWFVGLTAVSAAGGVLLGLIYFPLQSSSAGGSAGNIWTEVVSMVFAIIPANIFQSFLDNNTLQTMFLAVMTGVAMLIFKGRFPVITSIVSEVNLICSTILDAICSLMPWVIYVCIFNMLLTGDGGALISFLNVIMLIFICYILYILFCFISVAVIEKQSPAQYLKTIGPVVLIALTTASSSATYAPHSMIATEKQGIRRYLSNFSIPVGTLFCKPFLVPALFLMTLYIGDFYSVSFNMADAIVLVLLCLVLSVAVPPTQGMGAFVFTVLFNRFGIPLEGLAIAASIYMLLDYPGTAGNVFSINLSLLHTEYWLRKTDKKK